MENLDRKTVGRDIIGSTREAEQTDPSYPVNEESLRELDHLQGDQQADGDQVIVQDDERQQVVCKVSGDVTWTNTQTRNANDYYDAAFAL